MHDHNLDDLIIDSIEPKNSKTKSFLTIIALLIVVLIVAIILTKILLKTPNNDMLAFEQNATEMIAPELKLQETPKSEEAKKEPSLSNIIENEIKTPTLETQKPVTAKEPTVVIQEEKTAPEMTLQDVPEVMKAKKEQSLSNITEQEMKAPVAEPELPITIEEPTVVSKEEKTEERVKETVQITKEPTQVEKPVEITEQSKPKPMVRTVQKSSVPKPIKKPVMADPETLSSTRYYVQVGSFKAQPSTHFLSIITNNGFHYIITNPTADGTKKLLIGPYNDRASVNRTLVQVKDRINKRAFVVKR